VRGPRPTSVPRPDPRYHRPIPEREEVAMPEPVTVAPDAATDAPEATVAEELLVEEISIDGMCGVY
jgi:mycofactocin precursor